MLTEPARILLLACIVTAFVQVAKLGIPLLNGWAAVLVNVTVTGIGVLIVWSGHALTWNTLAIAAIVSLTAAGIHGTVTKVSDHPSPRENPTPSGTPAQNYKAHIE